MDSHDVADMYEKNMYETKIKTKVKIAVFSHYLPKR